MCWFCTLAWIRESTQCIDHRCLFPLLECRLELRNGVASISPTGDKLGLGSCTEDSELSSAPAESAPHQLECFMLQSWNSWLGGVSKFRHWMCRCLLPRTSVTSLVWGPDHSDSPVHEVRWGRSLGLQSPRPEGQGLLLGAQLLALFYPCYLCLCLSLITKTS